MKKTTTAIVFLLYLQFVFAQDFNLYRRAMITEGPDTLRYRILLPEHFNSGSAYPLLVFLHGSGERGNDNEAQLVHGADLFLQKEVRQKFQLIVIFPQCPKDTSWSYYLDEDDIGATKDTLIFPVQNHPTFPERMMTKLIDSLGNAGIADKKKIYVGGLSMGGIGTYDLLMRYPGYFAAAFSICGACDVKKMAKKAAHVPIWIFHGAKDDVVNPSYDRKLSEKLKKKKSEVKYTEYPDANHNSWDSAFAEPDLLPWLLSHHK